MKNFSFSIVFGLSYVLVAGIGPSSGSGVVAGIGSSSGSRVVAGGVPSSGSGAIAGNRPSAGSIIVGIADTCVTNTLVQIKTEYAEAVYAAGAVPLLLPSTTNEQMIAAMIDRIDMLLLPGGGDINPSRYRESDRGACTKMIERRDEWEFALLKAAVKRRLPVLGICRGCQMLNVWFGGTLWQDVPSEIAGAKPHRFDGEHPVSIANGSQLARLVGGNECLVNSRHHQAVRNLAPGFKVSASSPDGVTEAIEGCDYPALGVQFHPESLFAKCGRMEFLPLFRGSFAGLKPKVHAKSGAAIRTVVIPDYCPTNGLVCCKPNMTAALEMAGFVSFVVPFTPDDAVLDAIIGEADALMVAGGIGKLQDYKKRCGFEYRTIRSALRHHLPVAGVCHGSQVLNTYFGGTLKLTPQMSKEQEFLVAHRMPVRVPYTDNFHLADLKPGSRIARVIGSTRAVINSSHSNRSFEMGRGLAVTARAPDGVVEAFEHETLPVMAFQFHPERMVYDRRFVELLKESLSQRSRQ